MSPSAQAATPLIIEILVPVGAYPGGVCAVVDVFTEATVRSDGRAAYGIRLIAEHPGPVTFASGLQIVPDGTIHDPISPADTLVVAGGRFAVENPPSPELVAWIRRRSLEVRRYGALGPGAFLLGAAGLLDGKQVTTHWEFAPRLAQAYPTAIHEPDRIFVRDGRLFTTAGLAASTDLALALVEEDVGRELAVTVARFLVVYLKRPGGYPQLSVQLAAQIAMRSPIQLIQEWIRDHPKADLSIPELARRAGMSERNFSRIFRQESGVTPADFVEATRVDAAQRLLEETSLPLQRVASACGFSGSDALRRAVRRASGVGPREYRARFH